MRPCGIGERESDICHLLPGPHHVAEPLFPHLRGADYKNKTKLSYIIMKIK